MNPILNPYNNSLPFWEPKNTPLYGGLYANIAASPCAPCVKKRDCSEKCVRRAGSSSGLGRAPANDTIF